MANRQVALLNVRTVEGARAGDTLTEVGSRGLRLVVGKTGAKSWVYRFRLPDGTLKQTTLGAYPAMGISDAREAWAELKAGKKAGVDPQAATRAKKQAQVEASLTVKSIVDDYLTGHVDASRKEKGRAETRRLFDKYVTSEDGIGHLAAESIDVPTAAKFLMAVKAKSLASARVLRGELRAAWRQALEAGKVRGGNPFSDILKGKLPQLKRSRYLDENELRSFFAWLPDSGMSQDVQDALQLTLRTACRSGEIVSLPWSAVDLKGALLTLKATKTDVPRTIRLPAQVLAILKRRRSTIPVGEAFVFPSPIEGRCINQKALVWALVQARPNCPIEDFTAHDLRRTARTHLSRLGVSSDVGEAALGHTKGGVAGVYDLHRFEREVGDALQLLNDHFDKIAKPAKVVKLRRKANS